MPLCSAYGRFCGGGATALHVALPVPASRLQFTVYRLKLLGRGRGVAPAAPAMCYPTFFLLLNENL
jgi:hypothetical protein